MPGFCRSERRAAAAGLLCHACMADMCWGCRSHMFVVPAVRVLRPEASHVDLPCWHAGMRRSSCSSRLFSTASPQQAGRMGATRSSSSSTLAPTIKGSRDSTRSSTGRAHRCCPHFLAADRGTAEVPACRSGTCTSTSSITATTPTTTTHTTSSSSSGHVRGSQHHSSQVFRMPYLGLPTSVLMSSSSRRRHVRSPTCCIRPCSRRRSECCDGCSTALAGAAVVLLWQGSSSSSGM